jgi:hypothetical protein
MHCHIPAVLFALVGYMSEVALAFSPPEGCQSINNRISKSNVAVRLISEKQTANQAGPRRSAADNTLQIDALRERYVPQLAKQASLGPPLTTMMRVAARTERPRRSLPLAICL